MEIFSNYVDGKYFFLINVECLIKWCKSVLRVDKCFLKFGISLLFYGIFIIKIIRILIRDVLS